MMRGLRQQIVEEALRWERTPYHPNARLMGVGVDCAQLPIAVYSACGCMPELEQEYYSQQWMLHHDEELYLGHVRRYSREIKPSAARAGDFLIWRMGRTYSHGAILIDPPVVLHASIRSGVVLRADIGSDVDLSAPWHPMRAFTVFSKGGRATVWSAG